MKLRHKENHCPKLGSVRFEPTLLRLGSSPTPCSLIHTTRASSRNRAGPSATALLWLLSPVGSPGNIRWKRGGRSSLLSLVEFHVTTGGLCAEILHLTCWMRVCSTEPLLPTPPGRLYCVQNCCTRCLRSRWQSSSRDAVPALRSELSPVRRRPLPRRPHPGEQPRPPPDGQIPVLSSGSSVSPLLHQSIKLAFASNLNLASLH